MIGILLINLGTPDAPTKEAVRRYLKQFLDDPRVVTLPSLLRKILLYGVILPRRPKQTAKAYAQIWSEKGSPLMIHSKELQLALQNELGQDYTVEIGMRYGNPSIKFAIERLLAKQCSKIIAIPLFPQYSSAANGSAVEETLNCLKSKNVFPTIEIKGDFYENSLFIEAQSTIASQYCRDENYNPDFYLFSFHGLPENHIKMTDGLKICEGNIACPEITNASSHNRFCYRAQCYATARKLAENLKLNDSQYAVSFQSRLGRTPWIKPYTDFMLPTLRNKGIQKIAVICPSFVADCLETLEEIGIRAKEQWMQLGGEDLRVIPCVNAHPLWIEALIRMIK